MTAAAAALSSRPTIRILFRDADWEADHRYILDTWRLGWRLSEECRRMKGREYNAVWDDLVPHGVLSQPDTRILIGCCTGDQNYIWSWCCYTPGPVPIVHYAVVRPFVDTLDGGRTQLRRRGILARMLAAIGVRDEMIYTFRPTERMWSAPQPKGERGTRFRSGTRFISGEGPSVELGLLAAARAAGITAVFMPVVDQFLKPRRIRRTP